MTPPWLNHRLALCTTASLWSGWTTHTSWRSFYKSAATNANGPPCAARFCKVSKTDLCRPGAGRWSRKRCGGALPMTPSPISGFKPWSLSRNFTDVPGVPGVLASIALDVTIPTDLRYSAFTSLERSGPTWESVHIMTQLFTDEIWASTR
jgi:hypothetical protein